MPKKRSKIKRVNLSLKPNVVYLVQMLANRDDVSLTTKAAELLEQGIEVEEDMMLVEIAEQRLKEIEDGKVKAISLSDFKKQLKKERKKS